MVALNPVSIGLDIGQKSDPTAFAIVQAEMRPVIPYPLESVEYRVAVEVAQRDGPLYAGPREIHHYVRQIERLPLGTPYTEVVARMVTVCAGVVNLLRGGLPRLFIDATGVGQPIVDMLRAASVQAMMTPVYFTHGDRLVYRREGPSPRLFNRPTAGRRDPRPVVLSLGKAWLVARLTGLFESRRVHLRPGDREAAAMQRELKAYEIKATDVDNDKYGAFRVGEHDDMVTALGLATLDDPQLGGRDSAELKREPILPAVL